jgi:peptide/nickel transport system substrate-binding protein
MWYPLGGAFFARVQAIPTVTTQRIPAYAYNEIALNEQNPALADRDVRRALRLATDRKTLIAKVGHGVGVAQDVAAPLVDPFVPKDIPFVNFDPAKANELLDRAGWKRAADGIRTKNGARLVLTVATSAGTPDVDTQIELIRAWWKDAGIELTVQHYEASMLFAAKPDGGILNSGKFDVAFIAWTIPVPVDPFNLYDCKTFPPVGQNIVNYCNPKVDALFEDMHRTYDESHFKSDLNQILHILDDDVPAIISSGRENIFGYNKDLKNFTPNNLTVFDDMMNVDI